MPLTDKTALLEAAGRINAVETVRIEALGDDICLRVMTGAERDAFEASVDDGSGKRNLANLRARLLARTLCDEEGGRIFGDGDVAQLGATPAPWLVEAFEHAQRVNGLSEKDVDEMAGNSPAGQSDGSGSG